MIESELKPPNEAASELPPHDRLAARLRGFGPLGILAILVILAGNVIVVPLSAILVLLWTWRSRTPWSEIGYTRPRSWTLTVVGGIALGCALKFLMKIIVMPLLGASAINQAYHYLAGNRAAIPGMILTLIIVAGFGEETLFRGYMFERLGKLFGSSVGARVSIVLLTSVLFGLAHLPDQGLAGAEQALFTGVAFGTIFVFTRRIWMPMLAHAAFDLTAYVLIYWNLESRVAHLLFR